MLWGPRTFMVAANHPACPPPAHHWQPEGRAARPAGGGGGGDRASAAAAAGGAGGAAKSTARSSASFSEKAISPAAPCATGGRATRGDYGHRVGLQSMLWGPL